MMSPTGLPRRLLFVVALLLALVWEAKCQCTTTGGTQATPETCVFPFTYDGVEYYTCTTVNNGNTAWCAVTNNYPEDRLWGICDNPTCGEPMGTPPQCPVPSTGGNSNGANCVFPFTFQNQQYSNCRTGGVSPLPWCSTTANWDQDGLWGECIIISTRQNPTQTQNLPCVFPFTYDGQTYYDCQLSITDNLLWCGVVSMVSLSDTSTWGYCQTDGVCELEPTTPTDSPTATPTVTPAMQTNCPGATATTGGNSNGADCVFPFTYNGAEYITCTTENNPDPWCATTNNYPDDRLWGVCLPCSESTVTTPAASTQPTTPPETTPAETTPAETTPTDTTPVTTPACDGATAVGTTGGTANGAVCYFPFIYQGTSYDECITVNNNNQAWCATVPNYDDDKTWGNCGAEVCVTGTPTGTPTTTPQSLCPVMTEGGTDGGQNCQFPFTYNEQPQYACITDNYNKPWCGTTTNFPVDRLWGECIIMTTIGNRCQFPFNYKGVSYEDCTLVEQNTPWCATVPNLVALTNTNEWGFCSTPMEPNCPTATTTGSTPVVTGGCIDTFDEVVATLAFGGMYQAGILTVEACRTACLADATCVAVDWSLVAIRCFIHKDGYLDRLQMNSPNVNQYRRVPCLTTSTVGTTQAGATPVCADTFQMFSSTNAYNGISDNNAVTVETCQASCVGDTQCQAFDFTAANKCFIHYDGYLNRLGSVATSTQYRRIPCDVTPSVPATTPACPVTYSILANTLALGGEASATAMAVTACQTECTALGGDCIAFDFNRDKNICYFHDTLDDVIMGVATVDQYRKSTGCVSGTTAAGGGTPGGCVDTFAKSDNTFSFQGIEVVGTNTLAACEAVCLAEATCEAVDYNRLTMKCFWHTAATILTQRAATNIDQYVRQRCEVTAAQETTIVGGCVDTFDPFPNTLSLQGTGRGTVADADACQAICLSDAACAAFDFNRAKRDCYTHDADFLDRLGNASPANIDQYRRVYCSSAATDTTIAVGTATSLAASTACDPFQEFPMTASSGGAEIVGPRTVEDCKADCAADAACVGFDFNLNQNKCYGHSSTAVYSQTTSALRINQYRKTGTCQGVPTTAAPTTETQAPGGGTVATCDTFTMVGSTRSQNGTPYPLATTVSACTSSCMALANCAAFDFNPSTTGCTLHAMNFMDTVQVDVSGTNQYRRVFCQ